MRTVMLIGIVGVLGAGIYGLWNPSVRISRITVEGSSAPLTDIAGAEMTGSYFGIIPRNSIFFFPSGSIRARIVSAYPDIEAVSITRDSFSSISLIISERVPLAKWCGASPEAIIAEECYFFDATGFIYAPAAQGSANASTEKALTPFVVFSPLPVEQQTPIGVTLEYAERFAAIFDFARQIGMSGAPVRTVVIRGDEVDFYIATTKTRVTFLLGDEQYAFTSLMSARDTLTLYDPHLDYIDLRFSGKIYLKKREVK